MQSIINGTVDFVCGNTIRLNVTGFEDGIINKKGETVEELVRRLELDNLVFGGFALQVIRNMAGDVAEIYNVDLMKLRSDEKNEIFYYCDDWTKWGAKALIYPKYKEGDNNPTSIFYFKGLAKGVYPVPYYNASIIACELEKAINEFHINNINNGFMSNLVINFNNGQPNEQQKEEIERDVNEKFSGYQNAGRILISYNDSSENATTIERLSGDDFDEKYEALAKRSRTQIFTAFRANPNLFGIPNENNGFSQEEYQASFNLYNRTAVRPRQAELVDAFDKIFGVKGAITITPFSLEDNRNEQVS